jgi:hypothetical protein
MEKEFNFGHLSFRFSDSEEQSKEYPVFWSKNFDLIAITSDGEPAEHLVPTVEDVKRIINSFPDEESLKTFYKWHHASLENLQELQHSREHSDFRAWAFSLCLEVRYNPQEFLHDLSSFVYFIHVFGNVSNIEKTYDRINEKLNDLQDAASKEKRLSPKILALFPPVQKNGKDYNELIQRLRNSFESFNLVCTKLNNFLIRLANEPELADKYQAGLKALAPLFRNGKNLTGSIFPRQCIYCKRYYELPRKRGGKIRKHCNRRDCAARHSAQGKRDQRRNSKGFNSFLRVSYGVCLRCGEGEGDNGGRGKGLNAERLCLGCNKELARG